MDTHLPSTQVLDFTMTYYVILVMNYNYVYYHVINCYSVFETHCIFGLVNNHPGSSSGVSMGSHAMSIKRTSSN